MWIIVQIAIFLFFVVSAFFLPKYIYGFLTFIAIIFSCINIFVPWLLIIQIANIVISAGIGMNIIDERNNALKEMLEDTILFLKVFIEVIINLLKIIKSIIQNAIIKIFKIIGIDIIKWKNNLSKRINDKFLDDIF